jgi:hypothetical protein
MEMNTICDYRFWSWISGLSGVVDGWNKCGVSIRKCTDHL